MGTHPPVLVHSVLRVRCLNVTSTKYFKLFVNHFNKHKHKQPTNTITTNTNNQQTQTQNTTNNKHKTQTTNTKHKHNKYKQPTNTKQWLPQPQLPTQSKLT